MTTFGPAIPILRIFDEAKAREFYLDFLGSTVEFEHRFGDNFPLYMGLSLGGCPLHLSEHHGDCCPGAAVRISCTGIEELAKALAAKNYRYAKPGKPEQMPWGMRELRITDPFGNRLIFFQAGA